MIDIHCHILPGIDDGAQDLEMAIAMANAAVSQGITHVLATPHHRNPAFINPKATVEAATSQLQLELDKRGINLIVFPGQEVRMHGELMAHIKAGEILFTDLDETYLLIEFPTAEVPAYTDKVIFDLLTAGIRPVIVHPERNQIFIENIKRLTQLINQGCYAQLTTASYLGEFGEQVAKASRQMIEKQLIHLLASDAHRPHGARSFKMVEAYRQIEQQYGEQYVFDLQQNAKCLVNGEQLVTNFAFTSSKKKHKLFGFFK